jgi:hypothetical protein
MPSRINWTFITGAQMKRSFRLSNMIGLDP